MAKTISINPAYGIYEIYDNVVGKGYRGKAVDIYKGKSEHFKMLEKNKHYNIHLQNAFNKYGKEEFRFRIIEEFDDYNIFSEIDLKNKEIYYIKEFDTFKNGYNQTTGGDGMSGRSWNENQHKVMSEKMKGNKYGLGNKSNLGLKKSEESKEKVRQSLLGRKRGKYNTKKNDRETNC